VNFGDAIQTCFRKYATFSGRASRPEFWWWALFIIIAIVALSIVNEKLAAAFNVATLLPYFAVTARRLHDTDRSGWWQLVGFIPVIGWIVLVIWLCQPGKQPNTYGD
jgi:uncharacterized membrane protein YhaH (DUF805 family)